MGRYSINDIARLTGIKAHTIRIWEKRYGIFTPERTDSNIRWYSDGTLKKILKVAVLNNNGFKISHIADFSEAEINKQIEQINTDSSNGFENQIDALLAATIDLDEQAFTAVFNTLKDKVEFEVIVTEVFYPFFIKVGTLWQIGSINPAQEHFISNLIRQKMLVAIDQQAVPTVGTTVLLFLHENELHEIGLLFYNYLLRKKGVNTIYLGQCVPYDDLVVITRTLKFDKVITSFVSVQDEAILTSYIHKIATVFKDKELYLTGNQLNSLSVDMPNNVRILKDIAALHSVV